MKRVVLFLLLVCGLAGAWAIWQSRSGSPARPERLGRDGETPAVPPQAAPSVDAVLARDRAAAKFERGELGAARAELAPLVALPAPEVEDLTRAAIVDFADRAKTDPAPALARLAARAPKSPELHYIEARLALERGDLSAALGHFEIARAERPDDLPTLTGLAATLTDLERPAEARALLDQVLARGIEHGGVWYVQAVYRAWRLALSNGTAAEAERLQRIFEDLGRLGFSAPGPADLDRGVLAVVRPSTANPVAVAPAVLSAPRLPDLVAEAPLLPELANARELFAQDLDADGDADLLAAGAKGLFAAFQGPSGWTVERLVEGDVTHARAFDWGNRDSLDLLLVRGASVSILEHAAGAELLLSESTPRWSPSPVAIPDFPSPVEDLLLVDFDHEGDLDLLAVGAFGARLLRNDGAGPRAGAAAKSPESPARGAFTDVSREASLPADTPLAWCAIEDFDGDRDVDLLLGGPRGTFLMDSLRAGRFVDVAEARFGERPVFARAPLVADLDADGRPDLLDLGAAPVLWRQRSDGAFRPEAAPVAAGLRGSALATDIDLDGRTDVIARGSGVLAGGAGVLAFGRPGAVAISLPGNLAPGTPLVVADLDRDLDADVVASTARGIEVLRCRGGAGAAARLEPLGLKDNRRAVGTVIEVRVRERYRRIFWRGGPELVGCGAHAKLDVVRATWPNGAVQSMLDVPPTDRPFLDSPAQGLLQSASLVGSCPFLYSWNGSKHVFVTDVLGVTPLGLPMAPGMLVPPDHDEFVLLRGDQLVPRDGVFELQLTEELREVTYLDRARLDVVDHPAGTEIFPNERFTFPPFPEPHVHTLREPLTPRKATGSDGRDWTEALAAIDDRHAVPFEALEPQFLGLATPHWLELEFDAERVRQAKKLRLALTGWFFWTDASVNVASARTPDVRFVPPILQVRDADGRWVDAGPPLGFPAGKSKTMVVELQGAPGTDFSHVRIVSTLRLYWDRIALAVDGDDAPTRITPLEAESARLWARGFSRPIATGRADLPERFEWEALAADARWDQHPGRYTRLGETLPLIRAIDDRFVILGSGDALTLRFSARELPPPPEGWVRDYLLFLDGWAKDRDPNTVEALEVEPLPFHGMSGYPYGPDERFPATHEHERWRAEWNTRPARRLIPPLASAAIEEWLRSELRAAASSR